MKRSNLTDALAGNAEVQAAESVAEAVVLGIDFCLPDGIPLSQVQQIQLVKAALIAFDGHRAGVLDGFNVMSLLDEMGGA